MLFHSRAPPRDLAAAPARTARARGAAPSTVVLESSVRMRLRYCAPMLTPTGHKRIPFEVAAFSLDAVHHPYQSPGGRHPTPAHAREPRPRPPAAHCPRPSAPARMHTTLPLARPWQAAGTSRARLRLGAPIRGAHRHAIARTGARQRRGGGAAAARSRVHPMIRDESCTTPILARNEEDHFTTYRI